MPKKYIRGFCLCISVMAVLIICIIYAVREKAPLTGNIGDDYIEFFDVGQGDSALIVSNGRYCLVDTGTEDSAEMLCKDLKAKGINDIDLITVSHFHIDHTGGLYDIVSRFRVENLMFPPEMKDTTMNKKVVYAKSNVLAEDGDFYTAKIGTKITVGDFKMTVIYFNGELYGENNRSVYVMAQKGNVKFLFTGDGEYSAENDMLNNLTDVDCDVLKVAHHGSKGATYDRFLKSCSPEYAVISCGKGNEYGHPHEKLLNRLKSHNVEVFRTDLNGDITFSVPDNNKIFVTADK